MRRFTAYVAASTALTISIVAWALIDRPNFYSAAVYLSQSNACVLVLTNFCLLAWFLLIWALQRLFFGNLRALEIEALSERGWIVATEWLFAMSTFRGEFGVETAILFLLLIVGKAWGWICEGRIDTLDHQAQQQQFQAEGRGEHNTPPRFGWLHNQGRLMAAVAVNFYFALKTLWYCAEEVMLQARPGVMMMFVFEWAILLMNAIHLSCKYAAWGVEQAVLKKQQKERIEELRREAAEAAAADNDGEPLMPERIPEEDLDVHDLDLPGWESKGKFLFGLDIIIDSLKVVAYLAFFAVLTTFYGLPFYILRDLYLSVRSLFKRLNDFHKYQKATANMNSRYPDATAEELSEDNTCIICREEMHPWHETASTNEPSEQSEPQQYSTSDRQRPKKLPCGHILHFYCLRSWLERQQTCPTCRRSVLDQQPSTTGTNRANGAAQQPNDPHHQVQGAGARPAAPNLRNADVNAQVPQQPRNNAQQAPPPRGLLGMRFPEGFDFRIRMDQILRNRLLAAWNNAGVVPPPIAAGNGQQAPADNPPAGQSGQSQGQATGSSTGTAANGSIPSQSTQSHTQIPDTTLPLPHPAMEPLRPHLQSHIVHTQLSAIEAHLNMEMQSLQIAAHRAAILHQMQTELDRLRHAQGNLEARTMQIAMQIQQSGQPTGTAHIPQAQPTLLSAPPQDGSFRLPPGYRLFPLGNTLGSQPQSQTRPAEPGPSTSTGNHTSESQSSEHQQPTATASQQASSQASSQVTQPPPLDPNTLSAILGQMPNPTPTAGGFPTVPTPPAPTRSPFQAQSSQPGLQQQFAVNSGQVLQPGMPNVYNIPGWMPVTGQGGAQPAANQVPSAITNAWMEHQARQRQQLQDASRLQQLVQQAASSLAHGTSSDSGVGPVRENRPEESSLMPEISAASSNVPETTLLGVVAQPMGTESLLRVAEPDILATENGTGTVEAPPASLAGESSLAPGEPNRPNLLENLHGSWSFDTPETSSDPNQASNSIDRHVESDENKWEHPPASESTTGKGKGKERLVPNGSVSASAASASSGSKNPTVEDVQDEDD